MSDTAPCSNPIPPEKMEVIIEENPAEGSFLAQLKEEDVNRMASGMRKALASMRYNLYRRRGGARR